MIFPNLVGFKRLLVELRRIANSLEIIAGHFARLDGRLGYAGKMRKGGPEPELFHTTDEDMLMAELKRRAEFMTGGASEFDE